MIVNFVMLSVPLCFIGDVVDTKNPAAVAAFQGRIEREAVRMMMVNPFLRQGMQEDNPADSVMFTMVGKVETV